MTTSASATETDPKSVLTPSASTCYSDIMEVSTDALSKRQLTSEGILVETRDKRVMKVPGTVIEEWTVLRDLMEFAGRKTDPECSGGISADSVPLHLVEVDARTLSRIISFCEEHVAHPYKEDEKGFVHRLLL